MTIPRFFRLLVIAVLFAMPNLVCAQQANITISGKVRDQDDQQPIHSVSVSVDKRGIGTASNRSGEFILTIPSLHINDSLRVSCIGYQTRLLPISGLNTGQAVNIVLQKSNTQLKEATVAYHDPDKIIERAIARIPQNYINHPHITRGFYRMYTSKGQQPLELSEAVFDIYNFGYGDTRADLFKLLKARDEKNQRDFSSLELGQKPNTLFNYDVVNHLSSSGFLSEAGIKRHKFEYAGTVDVKGYQAYEIDFKEKPGQEEVTYRGKFYVDAKTYAFIYFDYGLSPSGVTEAQNGNFVHRILMGVDDVDVAIKQDHAIVGYQKVGEKWVLADVTGSDALDVNSTALKYDYTADVKFNYQVTSVDTVQTESFDTKVGRHDNINEYDSSAGEEFWKDYNILLADYNTEAVFKDIKAINNTVRLKDKFEEKERKMAKDTLPRMEALLSYYHDNGQFSGVALVQNKGKMLLIKGYPEKGSHIVPDIHTIFDIGLAAEGFTGLLITQLIKEGKLDAAAPASKYIPFYHNGDVTIGQLLSNQSGIPDYMSNEAYRQQIMTKTFALKDMVVNFCSDSLGFKSGESAAHSRSNFAVLALIAQEVEGKPFATLLQEKIFTPLQLTNTNFGVYTGGQDKNEAEGAAARIYDPANLAGAGGIFSSAADMLKLHNALQANTLISADSKIDMLKPRVEFKEANAWFDYGWLTDKNAFDATKKHPVTYAGGIAASPTIIARQEDTDTCIILLNSNGNLPGFDITDLILSMLN